MVSAVVELTSFPGPEEPSLTVHLVQSGHRITARKAL